MGVRQKGIPDKGRCLLGIKTLTGCRFGFVTAERHDRPVEGKTASGAIDTVGTLRGLMCPR